MWLIIGTALMGLLPQNSIKRFLIRYMYISAFRIMARAQSAVIKFHNKEYRPTNGSICVANHTSPVDVQILSVDNCYSLVSQQSYSRFP